MQSCRKQYFPRRTFTIFSSAQTSTTGVLYNFFCLLQLSSYPPSPPLHKIVPYGTGMAPIISGEVDVRELVRFLEPGSSFDDDVVVDDAEPPNTYKGRFEDEVFLFWLFDHLFFFHE
jgi:hypothetical protein